MRMHIQEPSSRVCAGSVHEEEEEELLLVAEDDSSDDCEAASRDARHGVNETGSSVDGGGGSRGSKCAAKTADMVRAVGHGLDGGSILTVLGNSADAWGAIFARVPARSLIILSMVSQTLKTLVDTLPRSALRALIQENARLREALDATTALAGKHADEYCTIVWAVRTVQRAEPNTTELLANVLQKRSKEQRKIFDKQWRAVEKHGDLQHGFNEGMLAAARLYGGYAGSYKSQFIYDCWDEDLTEEENLRRCEWTGAAQRENHLEDFPDLDT